MTTVSGQVTVGGTVIPVTAQVTLPSSSYAWVTTATSGQKDFPYAKITGVASTPWIGPNVWSGGPTYKQTLYANSPGDWYVSVSANTNFGGVAAYPNSGWNQGKAVDAYHSIVTSWSVSIPADSTKVAGWAGYDLWFNNWADEVMILVDITAPSQYNSTAVATATFGGMPWHLLVFGSERVWKPGTDDQHLISRATGSLDVQPFLTWMEQHGYLPAASTWTAGSFGFEVCDTHAVTQEFRVRDFAWAAAA